MNTLHFHHGQPDPLPLDLLLSAISSLPRVVLDRLVERAIEHLDALDGDPDIEDDDPAGGAVEDVGEIEEWREDGIVLDRPIYGEDQSLGPINEAAMYRNFKKAQLASFAQPTKENSGG